MDLTNSIKTRDKDIQNEKKYDSSSPLSLIIAPLVILFFVAI